MRKLICLFFVLLQSLGCLFSPNPVSAQETPSVYINEVAWAGSASSTADEWIELANLSESTVDLGGWRLTGAGASGRDLILPSPAPLLPKSTFLISNYAASDTHSNLAIEPDAVTTTISLSNSSLSIKLYDLNGNLIDQAGDGSTPPAGYSETQKASMIRVSPLLAGESPASWVTATTSLNLKNSDCGTPGYLDKTMNTAQNMSEATSTEAVLNYPTSTDPVLSDDYSSSTIPDPAASTTEIQIPSTQPDQTTSTDVSTEISPATSTEQYTTSTDECLDYTGIRLNEFMPNPSDGPEWIELYTSTTFSCLEELEIHDPTGKIASLPATATSSFLLVKLASAKLNNGGDSIKLQDKMGNAIDEFSYPQSHSGYSWARDEIGDWIETTRPTPGAENTIVSPPVPEPLPNTTGTVAQPIPIGTTTSATTSKPTTKKTPGQILEKSASKPAKTTQASNATKPAAQKSSNAKPVAKTAIAKKKTSSTKTSSKSNNYQNIDFDMLQDDTLGGIKIRIRGTVGSTSGLMTGRAFVLLNQDGRGLLIKLPTGLKYPLYGSAVELTGTLKFDTRDLPYVSMLKGDRWNNISSLDKPIPKDLWGIPSPEDAWSLVSASGTIQGLSGQTVTVLAGDYEYDLKIKPKTGYRVSRLKKGDTIRFSGLLDITNDRQAVVARSADEIEILAHAPEKKIESQTTQNKAGLPGWTPFGAALGVIGAIETTRKIRTKLKTPKKVSVK